MEDRNNIIIKTSVIGIIGNILLAGFKALVGVLSNSIAVVLDAVNNLSDALSSIITIIGTKLASKNPDHEHPLGYGRIEYLTATIISFIVLYAGITSLKESIQSIIKPQEPDYSAITLIIIIVGVIVKIFLGRYVKSVGETVNSDSLINSGEDATLDSIISASTLVAAVIYLIFHISLEAYLGAVISIIIIKSAIDMLREALNDILGERIAGELAAKVKETINSVDKVDGSYDLILHSYGPDRYLGSVHIAVPDTMTAGELDDLEREITEKVYLETNVVITGISVYATNTTDDQAKKMQNEITKIVMEHDEVLQMHGFYVRDEEKRIEFDIVLDFSADREKICQEIYHQVKEKYPDYEIFIQLDSDISD